MTFTEKLDKTWKEWPGVMGVFSLLTVGFLGEGLAWLVRLSWVFGYLLFAGYLGLIFYLAAWRPSLSARFRDWQDERASQRIAAKAGISLQAIRMFRPHLGKRITLEEAKSVKLCGEKFVARTSAELVNTHVAGDGLSAYNAERLQPIIVPDLLTIEMVDEAFLLALQAGGILIEEFQKFPALSAEELQELGQDLRAVFFDTEVLLRAAGKSGLTLLDVRAYCIEQIRRSLPEKN